MNKPMPMMEEEAPEEEDSAAKLYQMGQSLMDMAIAQGYSPEGEEEASEEEAPVAAAPTKKSRNVETMLGLLGK